MANHRPHAPTGETTGEATAGRLTTSGECHFRCERIMGSNGSRCQQIFLLGKRCTDTIVSGLSGGYGRALMLYWLSKYVLNQDFPEQPSIGMIDSQSVKRTQRGQLELGEDGYKKVKGRKRHVVVDVLGLILGCYVSAANVADGKASPAVLVPVIELYKRLEKVLADLA